MQSESRSLLKKDENHRTVTGDLPVEVIIKMKGNPMSDTLAIRGGTPAVPEGTIKGWPPIDDTDRATVIASLENDNHAFGPNCEAFQEEFAAWNGNAYALTTNSGTAALHMAVVACGGGRG